MANNKHTLTELMEADQNGRLLVMPCDMGTRIYIVVSSHRRYRTAYFIKHSRLSPANVYRACREYGERVFCNYDDACAALVRLEREAQLKLLEEEKR